jgi:hypothetical protein
LRGRSRQRDPAAKVLVETRPIARWTQLQGAPGRGPKAHRGAGVTINLMGRNNEAQPGDQREQILSLCRAVRQATSELWLDRASAAELGKHLLTAEASASAGTADLDSVRGIRYILLESADGPLAPFLADAAAQIIGDDFGKLFYKRS